MAVYYGDLYLDGTGGSGTWADPYKRGDLADCATNTALAPGDELRIKGKPDSELFTDLNATLTLDVDNSYIGTDTDLTTVLAQNDVIYLPSATRLRFYPLYSVSATQLGLNNSYYPYYCYETGTFTDGKKVAYVLGGTDTYFIRGLNGDSVNKIKVSFGWDTETTQNYKTLIARLASNTYMYWFSNCSYLEIDGSNLYILNRYYAYFGNQTSTAGQSLYFTNPIESVILYSGWFYVYNYIGGNGLKIYEFMHPYYYSPYSYTLKSWDCYAFVIDNWYLYQINDQYSDSYNYSYYVGNVYINNYINFRMNNDSYFGNVYIRGSFTPRILCGTLEIGNLYSLAGTSNKTVSLFIYTWGGTLSVTRSVGAVTDSLITCNIYLYPGGVLCNSDFSWVPRKTSGVFFANVYSYGYYKRVEVVKTKLNLDVSTAYIANGYGGYYYRDGCLVLRDCVDYDGTPVPNRECVAPNGSSSVMCEWMEDSSVYRTSAPSLVCRLYNGGRWYRKEMWVKGEKNSTTTVTLYIRKNTYYGSSNLPYIKLRYFDANGNEQSATATMTDVNDTWVQLQVSATPGIEGDMIFEIWVYGASNDARVWVDDISVEVV